MVLPSIQIWLSIILLSLGQINAWDSDDLEVFDVVEEVGVNFYDLLDVKQDDKASDIKKAFRRLSLIWHPDKSSSPDAEVKFRQLAAVNEILTDSKRRAIYDNVLEHGLPDWRQAVYYYRRVRKMGLIEMSVILFVIVTIGQYLVAWAAYFEKKYAIEEFLTYKSKKLQKKQKKGKIDGSIEILPELMTMTNALPKPSVSCTLPVQICKLVWFTFVELPPILYYWTKDYFEERRKRKEDEAISREESEEEEERVTVVRERGPRRRKGGFVVPEVSAKGSETPSSQETNKKTVPQEESSNHTAPIVSGGLWTDDDLSDLIRLMKKYPPGTNERWEKIGAGLRRPATEVAHMAHKIKEEGFKPQIKDEENQQDVLNLEPKKVKTRGGKLGVTEEQTGSSPTEEWSQVQQKAFETALAKYPKGGSSDRWDKIANCVPGKTREECMQRYKLLVDLVKKKKEKEEVVCTPETLESAT